MTASAALRAILWDFDGTLVDTRARNLQVNRRIIQELTGRGWEEFPVLRSQTSYDEAQRAAVNWREFYRANIDLDDHQIDWVILQEMADYLFVVGEAVKVVDAGQVNQLDHLAGEEQLGAEQVDSDARPVADPGRSAGGAVEERGFAGIRHAHQGDASHQASV